jgi:hypothetical protein
MAPPDGDPTPGRRLNTRIAVLGLEMTLLGILAAVVGAPEAAMILGAVGVLFVFLSL